MGDEIAEAGATQPVSAAHATDLTRRELVDQLMKMGATALAAAMGASERDATRVELVEPTVEPPISEQFRL